jgi:hypothetical protein
MSRVCGGTSSAIKPINSTATAARAVRSMDPQECRVRVCGAAFDETAVIGPCAWFSRGVALDSPLILAQSQ